MRKGGIVKRPTDIASIGEEMAYIEALMDEARRRHEAIRRTIKTLFNQGLPAWSAPVEHKNGRPKRPPRTEVDATDLDLIVYQAASDALQKGWRIASTGQKSLFKLNIAALAGISRAKLQASTARLLSNGSLLRDDDGLLFLPEEPAQNPALTPNSALRMTTNGQH